MINVIKDFEAIISNSSHITLITVIIIATADDFQNRSVLSKSYVILAFLPLDIFIII